MCVCVCVCVYVCVCVCPHLRLLITNGVMWRDMDLIGLVKQVLQLLYGNCSHYISEGSVSHINGVWSSFLDL